MSSPKSPYHSPAIAKSCVKRWESVSFGDVHNSWLHLLPTQPGLALDVGAGSGRDAAALAGRGWDVVAVEPSSSLREIGEKLHPSARIQWLEDSLPGLKEVYRLDYRYDLILLSAVWMFTRPARRERAFRKLTELLKPGGILVFTLRHGPAEPGHRMHPSDPAELEHLGRQRALLPVSLPRVSSPDALNRKDVHWTTVVFRLPDDGTGALPLLRHVIVNDQKSSTYKLALLRVLVRIADGARGMILERNNDYVTVPFGLVALYWLKVFKPLLQPVGAKEPVYPQQANSKAGLGFVKEGFRALASRSPHDFRIGSGFTGTDARYLSGALADICRNIRAMPAHFTTLPGSDQPVFLAEYGGKPRIHTSRLTIDREFLRAFGDFRIPVSVWDAMSRYACWIEPAILNEWSALMRRYDDRRGVRRPADRYHQALTWMEAERDTRAVRELVEQMKRRADPVCCVWTGRRLRAAFVVDHCLPFTVWPNNDLWNLMPASKTANSKKSHRLPSAELMYSSRDRILDWWKRAYGAWDLFPRFRDEAFASLPLAADMAGSDETAPPVLNAVFAGAENQRVRLRADQQVEEWAGASD